MVLVVVIVMIMTTMTTMTRMIMMRMITVMRSVVCICSFDNDDGVEDDDFLF